MTADSKPARVRSSGQRPAGALRYGSFISGISGQEDASKILKGRFCDGSPTTATPIYVTYNLQPSPHVVR